MVTKTADQLDEADEVELHALDRDAGLVLDHEVQATAVVGALDTVELDQRFSFPQQLPGEVRRNANLSRCDFSATIFLCSYDVYCL